MQTATLNIPSFTPTVESVPFASSMERPAAGLEGLASAVIALACSDYLKLVEEGLVIGDKVSPTFTKRKILEGEYMHVSQVEQLISWLKDGSLEDWLNQAHLKVDTGYLLKKLGVTQ